MEAGSGRLIMSKEPKGKNNDKKSSLRIKYKGPIPTLFYCDIQLLSCMYIICAEH